MTIGDELGLPQALAQRSSLSPRDGATIDQLQAGMGEAFGLMELPGKAAAAGALVALTALVGRTQTLLTVEAIHQTTANSVEHCAQELRRALVGLVNR